MNQLQTRPAPAGSHRGAEAVRLVVIAVLVLATLFVSLRLVEGPDFVDAVTVVNNTNTELDVDTAGSRTGDWTPAGVALPRTTTQFTDVVDHGTTWWIRVTSGGESFVFPVTRASLAARGWRVVVPGDAATELQP